jgi:Na+-driven multidrug efflux pump
LVANANGAKDYKRLRTVIKRSNRAGKIFTIFAIIILAFLAIAITPLMTPDKTIYKYVVLMAIIEIIVMPIVSYVFIYDGTFMGLSKNTFLMFASAVPFIFAITLFILFDKLNIVGIVGLIIIYLIYDIVFIGGRAIFAYFGIKKFEQKFK